jgi:hypothetical protein
MPLRWSFPWVWWVNYKYFAPDGAGLWRISFAMGKTKTILDGNWRRDLEFGCETGFGNHAVKHEQMRMWKKIAIATVCILPLAIFVVFPRFVRTRRIESDDSCISLLRQIDGATEQWMLEKHKTTNDIPTWDDLVGSDRYIRVKPVCPQGGCYTLSRVGDYPQCSIPMHSLYFGMVGVTDESGTPVTNAKVSVEGVAMKGDPTFTDSDGHAFVTRFAASVENDWSRGRGNIIASREGYETGRVALPTGWPVFIKLKKIKTTTVQTIQN